MKEETINNLLEERIGQVKANISNLKARLDPKELQKGRPLDFTDTKVRSNWICELSINIIDLVSQLSSAEHYLNYLLTYRKSADGEVISINFGKHKLDIDNFKEVIYDSILSIGRSK